MDKKVWACIILCAEFDTINALAQTCQTLRQLVCDNEEEIYKLAAHRMSLFLIRGDMDQSKSSWYNSCQRFQRMAAQLASDQTTTARQSEFTRPLVISQLNPGVIGPIDLETNITVHTVVPAAIAHKKDGNIVVHVYSRRHPQTRAVFSLQDAVLESINEAAEESVDSQQPIQSWDDYERLEYALAQSTGLFSRPVSLPVLGKNWDAVQYRLSGERQYYLLSTADGERRSSPETTLMDMKRKPPFHLLYFDGDEITSSIELETKHGSNLTTDPYNAFGADNFALFGPAGYVEIRGNTVTTCTLPDNLQISELSMGLETDVERIHLGYATASGHLLCCNSLTHTVWALRIDGKGDGQWHCLMQVDFDQADDPNKARLFLSKTVFYGRYILLHGSTDIEDSERVSTVFVTYDMFTGASKVASFDAEYEGVLRLGSYIEPVQDPLTAKDKWYIYSNKWVVDRQGHIFLMNEVVAEEWISTWKAMGFKGTMNIPLHYLMR